MYSVVSRSVILLLCVVPLCASGAPAEPIRGYTVDVWKSDNGLPQNTASSIAQSPDGFLWIGTQAGLARFDGLAFEILTRQSSPGLIDSEVRHLLTTHDGVLWMSTGGGLCRMASGKVVGQDSAPGMLLCAI
jgi:ligand-binding sensor domain-containing protein